MIDWRILLSELPITASLSDDQLRKIEEAPLEDRGWLNHTHCILHSLSVGVLKSWRRRRRRWQELTPFLTPYSALSLLGSTFTLDVISQNLKIRRNINSSDFNTSNYTDWICDKELNYRVELFTPHFESATSHKESIALSYFSQLKQLIEGCWFSSKMVEYCLGWVETLI